MGLKCSTRRQSRNQSAFCDPVSGEITTKFLFSWLEDPAYGTSLFCYDSLSQSADRVEATEKERSIAGLSMHLRYTVHMVGNSSSLIYGFKDQSDPPEFIRY